MKYLSVALLLFLCGVSVSQGLFESSLQETGNNTRQTNFSGFTRGSIYSGSKSFDFSAIFGEFSLQTDYHGAHAILKSDLRVRSGLFFDTSLTEIEIKEAYAGYQTQKFDFLLGQQIIHWGRTDGFNPTNNITPNHYFFLTADPDDQRMSNFLVRAKIRFTINMELELIGIPFYKPSVYRYDLFNISDAVTFTKSAYPEISFENFSHAARLNFDFPLAGFSISWFRGFDPFYAYRINYIDYSTGSPAINYITETYQKNSLGADLSIPVRSMILRAEAAYNLTEDYKNKINVPNPGLEYVGGIEGNLFKTTIIAQYIGKFNVDFQKLSEPSLPDQADITDQIRYSNEMICYETEIFIRKIFNQQKKTNHAFSVSFNKSFAYETIQADFTAYYNITSEDFMLRPSITWKPGDALSLSTGMFYVNGPDQSLFNYSSKVLNGVFVECKTSF